MTSTAWPHAPAVAGLTGAAVAIAAADLWADRAGLFTVSATFVAGLEHPHPAVTAATAAAAGAVLAAGVWHLLVEPSIRRLERVVTYGPIH